MSVKVLTKIGTVNFIERKNSFKVKCKKHSSFVIRKSRDGESFEATQVPKIEKGLVQNVAIGKTAEACYKNAVKIFWRGEFSCKG